MLLSLVTTLLLPPQPTARLARKALECRYLPPASLDQVGRKGRFGVIPAGMGAYTLVAATMEMSKQKHRFFLLMA